MLYICPYDVRKFNMNNFQRICFKTNTYVDKVKEVSSLIKAQYSERAVL